MSTEIDSTSASSLAQDHPPSKGNGGSSSITAQWQMTQYKGPWPPPSFLAEYEKVMPGLGKRIIENLLEQAEQRQENEKALVKTIPRGQHYALTVVVLVICLAGVLAYLHYPWAAALIVSLDLAMMVGAFLRGPSSFEALFKALERKSEEKKKLLESMKE